MDYLRHAKELGGPPPVGSCYSVTLPASEKPGRSKVYRHWRFRDGLLKTLDPKVSAMVVYLWRLCMLIYLPGRLRRCMRCSKHLVSLTGFSLHCCLILTSFAAKNYKRHKCLGYRPYDSTTKSFGPYKWLDYQTVQQRRAALGVGLAELHKQAGIEDQKYGIGLWCQNRPEWQITGGQHTASLPCLRGG